MDSKSIYAALFLCLIGLLVSLEYALWKPSAPPSPDPGELGRGKVVDESNRLLATLRSKETRDLVRSWRGPTDQDMDDIAREVEAHWAEIGKHLASSFSQYKLTTPRSKVSIDRNSIWIVFDERQYTIDRSR
jgi:hypothetical protein